MELQKLFETQRVLDAHITKEKGLKGQDLLPMKILALQVELGELANEWRGFKFWSEDQEPRTKIPVTAWGEPYKNPLLEEYVDCLHFILSIGLDVGDTIFDMEDYEIHFEDAVEVSLTDQFVSTNWLAGCLIENRIHYEQTLFNILKLGEMLGFTWEQIESAYYDKNKINHERQATGY